MQKYKVIVFTNKNDNIINKDNPIDDVNQEITGVDDVDDTYGKCITYSNGINTFSNGNNSTFN